MSVALLLCGIWGQCIAEWKGNADACLGKVWELIDIISNQGVIMRLRRNQRNSDNIHRQHCISEQHVPVARTLCVDFSLQRPEQGSQTPNSIYQPILPARYRKKAGRLSPCHFPLASAGCEHRRMKHSQCRDASPALLSGREDMAEGMARSCSPQAHCTEEGIYQACRLLFT
jgi:hypothetical protein